MALDLSIKLLIAACFSLASVPSFAAAALTTMEADFAKNGGRYVIGHYFNCPDACDGVRAVETGTPSSVAFGVKMLKYSDAGSTDDIYGALAEALVTKPESVLPYVNSGPRFEAEHICLPFLSVDEPKRKLRALVERTRKSLLRVTAGHLERQKTACLKEVGAALANLR